MDLSAPADKVEVRVYSVALALIAVADSGPVQAGWVEVSLPAVWAATLPNGLYYVRATATSGSRSAPSKSYKMLVLR